MNILNLDSFARPKRQLTLNGKTYALKEIDVQGFIDALKAAEDLESASVAVDPLAPVVPERMSKAIENSIVFVLEAIPGVPAEEIRALSIDALSVLLKFIRGEDLTDSAAAETEGADAKKPI